MKPHTPCCSEIEATRYSGVPVNVTLLFSRDQYLAAAEAFLPGIERRLSAGLNPNVGSVASVFVSQWDAAVADKAPAGLRNQLGIAIAKRTYRAARQMLTSPQWQRIYNLGARPQRLLWASTGTKDPAVSDILYVKEFAAPYTVRPGAEPRTHHPRFPRSARSCAGERIVCRPGPKPAKTG